MRPTRREAKRAKLDSLLRSAFRIAPFAIAAAALAVPAAGYSFARLAANSRPDASLALMPSLPPALTARADRLVLASGEGSKSGNIAEARRLAMDALRRAPLDARALRLLAISSSADSRQVSRLLTSATRVSRRDIGTQLLQIELNVAENDITQTLRHYDQALRLKPSVGPTLYPVLLSATDQPELLDPIRTMVARDPAWLPAMIAWTIENTDYLKPVARVIDAVPPGSDAMDPGYGQALVEALVSQNQFSDAFRVYRRYSRGTSVPRLSGGFIFRPLDWQTSDNYETGSDLVGGNAPYLRVFADSGSEGVFLSRLISAPPGRYRYIIRLENVSDDTAGTISLITSCQSSQEDRELSRAHFGVKNGTHSGEFIVPAKSCPFQWLRFSVASRQGRVETDLTRLAINRVG